VGGRELRDKIAGAVYGFVIGGAVRVVASSFDRESQSSCLHDVEDAICESSLDLDDESQMTWCIMKVLVECPDLDNLEASRFKRMVADEFARWDDSHGVQVDSILNDGIDKYRKLHKFADKVDNAFGRKALIRAMPCAVIGRDDLNLAQADITYPCEASHRGLQMYSKLLKSYLMCKYPYNESKCLRSHLEASEGDRKSIDSAHSIMLDLARLSSRPTFKECVTETVANKDSSPEAILAACSLIGARFGLEQVPRKWIGKLDVKWKCKAGAFINFATKYLKNFSL
jgi:ADP-ribosylglycohydrolase